MIFHVFYRVFIRYCVFPELNLPMTVLPSGGQARRTNIYAEDDKYTIFNVHPV